MLETALSRTVETPEGRVAGKRLLARLVVEAATTGKVKFPGEDGASTIGIKDWMEFVKWIYQYLEPPTAKHDIDARITGELTWKDFISESDNDNPG